MSASQVWTACFRPSSLIGHHHLGIDDCRNLRRLAVSLVQKHGATLTRTGGKKTVGWGGEKSKAEPKVKAGAVATRAAAVVTDEAIVTQDLGSLNELCRGRRLPDESRSSPT